jgi:hypothetical protein
MAIATIVTAWQDGTNAYASARVSDGPPRGAVEYLASTPLRKDDGTVKTGAELKADLIAALKSVRDAQLAAVAALAGVSGTVTV